MQFVLDFSSQKYVGKLAPSFLLGCWVIAGKRHDINIIPYICIHKGAAFLLVLFPFKMSKNLEVEEKELSSDSHNSKPTSTRFNSHTATESYGKGFSKARVFSHDKS